MGLIGCSQMRGRQNMYLLTQSHNIVTCIYLDLKSDNISVDRMSDCIFVGFIVSPKMAQTRRT